MLKNPPAAKGTALEGGGGWQEKWGVPLGDQEGHDLWSNCIMLRQPVT